MRIAHTCIVCCRFPARDHAKHPSFNVFALSC